MPVLFLFFSLGIATFPVVMTYFFHIFCFSSVCPFTLKFVFSSHFPFYSLIPFLFKCSFLDFSLFLIYSLLSVLLASWLSEVPITSSLGLMNLPEWLTQRNILFSRLSAYYKRIELKSNEMEKMHRAG